MEAVRVVEMWLWEVPSTVRVGGVRFNDIVICVEKNKLSLWSMGGVIRLSYQVDKDPRVSIELVFQLVQQSCLDCVGWGFRKSSQVDQTGNYDWYSDACHHNTEYRRLLRPFRQELYPQRVHIDSLQNGSEHWCLIMLAREDISQRSVWSILHLFTETVVEIYLLFLLNRTLCLRRYNNILCHAIYSIHRFLWIYRLAWVIRRYLFVVFNGSHHSVDVVEGYFMIYLLISLAQQILLFE